MAVITYHNDINKVPLENFNEKEINLFFALLFQAKKDGSKQITISFLDLKKLANGDSHSSRFINSIKNVYTKLLNLKHETALDNGDMVFFNIFNEFIISTSQKEVTIEINRRFSYIFDTSNGHFTKFDLADLVSLRSSYSKNMFRLLKQFESCCMYISSLKKFKKIMCIPPSYSMGKIDEKVFKPIFRELSPLFKNLKIIKIKKGKSVDKIKLTWISQNRFKRLNSQNGLHSTTYS